MWHHAFLTFDDNEYIYRNPHVTSGFTWANVVWAFTAYHSNNWHPLTWLSHMLDCQWFGIQPGPHHLMNALLHTLNSILLFLLMRRMTGTLWKSAFVAVAFAVHPMHVESVAWASERKDVLSTCFALLTIWSYVSYARNPHGVRYALFALLFVLGIMAKPMLVTLPFVLLLLDYWPLQRFRRADRESRGSAKTSLARLLAEKAPLLPVIVASCLLTVQAQTAGGVVASLAAVPLPMRVANALVSYVRYIVKLLAPVQQAFTYPYPEHVPVGAAVGACILLAAVSYYFVRNRRARPYAVVGWFWFLGTLVPVIGVVQVGMQAMADRYAYIPSIGLFILLAWGLDDINRRWPRRETIMSLAAGVALVVFGCQAWVATGYWRDSITFFTRDVQVVKDNALSYRHLGVAYFEMQRYDEAIKAFRNVLRLSPEDGASLYNLAMCLDRQGRLPEAARCYEQTIRLVPGHAAAHNNLAILLARMDRPEESITRFREVVRLRPDRADSYTRLAAALSRQGRYDEAIVSYEEAVRRAPLDAATRNDLGSTLARTKRWREAFEQYARALSIDPQLAEAEANLGLLCLQSGDSINGRKHLERAVELRPDLAGRLGAQTMTRP
jgi:tetratricopeptide (TPR) repeat protein